MIFVPSSSYPESAGIVLLVVLLFPFGMALEDFLQRFCNGVLVEFIPRFFDSMHGKQHCVLHCFGFYTLLVCGKLRAGFDNLPMEGSAVVLGRLTLALCVRS